MSHKSTFRVLESFDHPHGGRILRLRLQGGEAPSLKELKGATLLARGPDGEEDRIKVGGFALFGGKPSDARLIRTGRIDVVLDQEDGGSGDAVVRRWTLSGPA